MVSLCGLESSGFRVVGLVCLVFTKSVNFIGPG